MLRIEVWDRAPGEIVFGQLDTLIEASCVILDIPFWGETAVKIPSKVCKFLHTEIYYTHGPWRLWLIYYYITIGMCYTRMTKSC